MFEHKFDELRDDVIKALASEIYVVQIDYRDHLTPKQIEAIASGDWESLEDSIDVEFWMWAEGEVYNVVDWEVREMIAAWSIRDQLNYEGLWDEFFDTQQWHQIAEAVRDRDTSNPLKDLASNTGPILMRHVVVDADHALYGNHTIEEVVAWIQENLTAGSTFEPSEHNLKVIQSVLNECMFFDSTLTAMIVYATDALTLYETMYDTEFVEVVNPHLYLGNYYAGDGMCSDQPLEATFRIKRSDLRTDKGAPGYGWGQVAGVYTHPYECEVRSVEHEEAA